MKRLNTLLQIICIGLFAMSCGSDEPAKISSENAKIAFDNANNSVVGDLESVMEAPGVTAMNSLSSLSGAPIPFGRMRSYEREDVKNQIKSSLSAARSLLIGSTANGRVSGDEPFSFNDNKGVYTYDPETGLFDSDLGGNIIEIHFPSTSESTSNDAVFRLNAYSEEYTPYGDDLYSPTIIKATLHVSNELQAEIDLDVDYGDNDDVVKANIYLYLNPYTIDFNFDDTKSTATSFSADLTKAGKNVVGVGLNVVFYTAEKQDPKSLSGYFQIANVRFIFSANANANSNDINDYVAITVTVDGAIAGKVIFEIDEVTQEPVPYIKYNDGTTEPLQDVFEDLAVQLEGILSM